jgi:hypothetical protein
MPVTLRRGDPDRKQRDRFEGGLPKSKKGCRLRDVRRHLPAILDLNERRPLGLLGVWRVHRAAYFCFADFIAKPLQFEIALCDDGVRKLSCIFRLRRDLVADGRLCRRRYAG